MLFLFCTIESCGLQIISSCNFKGYSKVLLLNKKSALNWFYVTFVPELKLKIITRERDRVSNTLNNAVLFAAQQIFHL